MELKGKLADQINVQQFQDYHLEYHNETFKWILNQREYLIRNRLSTRELSRNFDQIFESPWKAIDDNDNTTFIEIDDYEVDDEVFEQSDNTNGTHLLPKTFLNRNKKSRIIIDNYFWLNSLNPLRLVITVHLDKRNRKKLKLPYNRDKCYSRMFVAHFGLFDC